MEVCLLLMQFNEAVINQLHIAYYLPNDEVELDRLDFMHQLMLLLLHNKLHFAPIERKPIRILDVGTGTGIWAIDMGIYTIFMP